MPNVPPILAEQYSYDLASNLLSRSDRRPGAAPVDRDTEYSYDLLHRLTAAARGVRDGGWTPAIGTQEWDFDTLGNLAQVRTDLNGDGLFTNNHELEDRMHNAANRLVEQQEVASPSVPAQDLAYDAAGNLVSHQKSASLTVRYTYDAWKRLVRIQHELAGSPPTMRDVAEYEYKHASVETWIPPWREVRGRATRAAKHGPLRCRVGWRVTARGHRDRKADLGGTSAADRRGLTGSPSHRFTVSRSPLRFLGRKIRNRRVTGS
jgi:YD repeat-containing protein